MKKIRVIPYKKFNDHELILRDYLALDRTFLANSRTFLAYLRTALAFIVSGVSFQQFFPSKSIVMLGIIFIPCGLICALLGLFNYIKTKKNLTQVLDISSRKKL